MPCQLHAGHGIHFNIKEINVEVRSGMEQFFPRLILCDIRIRHLPLYQTDQFFPDRPVIITNRYLHKSFLPFKI